MDRSRALVSVVMNFRVAQGLGIFIPTEYHWLHEKDLLLWRHFGQSKLSGVPARAIKSYRRRWMCSPNQSYLPHKLRRVAK